MRVVRKMTGRGVKTKHKLHLGPVEARIMGVLWKHPGCTVQDVQDRLPGNRAYTTVMTTMARLFKKGLLRRSKRGHGFVYSPQLSAEDWGRLAVAEFVTHFVAVPEMSRNLLLSSLESAVNNLDPKLSAKRKMEVGMRSGQKAKNN